MRIRPLSLVFLLISLLPLALTAGTVTIGIPGGAISGGDLNLAAVRTDIDLAHPATLDGSITTVTYGWTSYPCVNALKIKFFRRNGNQLTMTAERGPFTSSYPFSLTLTPAVPVLRGDLIAIARVANCGNAYTSGGVSAGYLQYAADVTGTVNVADGTAGHSTLLLGGSGPSSESILGIIPVVGSTQGGFGSRWRTSIQFPNPSASSSTSVKVVFHRSGVSGSPTDPLLSVTLGPAQVTSYDDVVGTLGQTGLGSLDIILPDGKMAPMGITRIFNDAGSAGTSGFTEDMIDPAPSSWRGAEVLSAGITGFLVAPISPASSRFNVGVRTLDNGAVLNVTERNAAGAVVRTATKTYGANYFEQVDVATFVGGAIGADDSIQISVSSGSAIIYGSTIDNTTNDSAIQCAYGVFAPA